MVFTTPADGQQVLTAITSDDQAGHDEADGRDSGAESAEFKDDRSVQEIRSPKKGDRSFEATSALGGNDGPVQARIQQLQQLLDTYQDRPSQIPMRHIGLSIQELAPLLFGPWEQHYDRDLKIRSLTLRIMNFVLDQFQDTAALDRVPSDGRTPLWTAILYDTTDCVAALLARGADPYKESHGRTPFQLLSGDYGWDNTTDKRSLEFRVMVCLRDINMLWKRSPSPTRKPDYFSFAWTMRRTFEQFSQIHRSASQCQPITLGQDEDLMHGPWNPSQSDTSSRDDLSFNDEILLWVHVPHTNVPVLYNICRTIEGIVNRRRSSGCYTQILDSFCASIRPPIITPGNSVLTYRDPMYNPLVVEGRTIGSTMVFPFLILERICEVLGTRARYEDAKKTSKKLPASKYGFGDRTLLGICLDRTLDEAYFPGMDEMFFDKRNMDQVVSRVWRRSSDPSNSSKDADTTRAPILMVPQMWLWQYESVLLSAYSSKRVSGRIAVFSSKDGWQTPRFFGDMSEPTPSVELQMGLVIANQVFEFGEEHDQEDEGSRFRSALQMFEVAVVTTLSDVQRYLDGEQDILTMKGQKKKEREFIHTMSDIHSELDMISAVLQQQAKIMNKFLRETRRLQEAAAGQEKKGWALVKEARALINEYENRILKIHRDADRVDKTIESYLDLKRTYASIEDTRNGLVVGIAASAFALVTVIFTPLSFMTSLLALPVDHFARQQIKVDGAEDGVFRTSYVAGYTALAGILTWVITLALLSGPLYTWWKSNDEWKERWKKSNDGWKERLKIDKWGEKLRKVIHIREDDAAMNASRSRSAGTKAMAKNENGIESIDAGNGTNRPQSMDASALGQQRKKNGLRRMLLGQRDTQTSNA